MYVDAALIDNKVVAWVRKDDGTLVKVEEPASFYVYVNDPDGEMRTLYGNNVTKKVFNTYDAHKSFIASKHYSEVWEADISPIYKFLSDNFYKYSPAVLNTGFFDIEVDYDLNNGLGFPTPENPHGVINAITLFDVTRNKFHSIVLTDDKGILVTDDNYEVLTYHCVSEKQLLDTFVHLIEDIDILSSWNGDYFDIPYIIARCVRNYGEKRGKSILCRDGFRVKEIQKKDKYGKDQKVYQLVGRVHLDLLSLYRKFTQGERENYKLDTIALLEVGEEKIKYDGDLGDLYRTDPLEFFTYNKHDTYLLLKINDKLKFIELAIAMAKQATIKLSDIFGSIKYLEHSIMNYCHFDREENLILPTRNDHNSKEEFPGAFVLHTKDKNYQWTQSIDLASLYPSTIRAINISPETHILQCENKFDDFIVVTEKTDDMITLNLVNGGDSISMTAREINQMIRENNFTISANGSIFNNENGLIPEVLALWYSERARTKKLSKKHAKEGNIEKAKFYDQRQNLMKLSLNSLYGAISNPFSRFYSVDLAASVTLSGQIIERFQIWKADQLVKTAN